MALIYDFKGIKKACNEISTDILGPDKGEKYVEFEPEVEFEDIPATKPSTPRFMQKAPPVTKGDSKYCEACRCRLVPGYGWYCLDCDEFVAT